MREGLVSSDAEFLAHCSDSRFSLEQINPIRYREPLAPWVAAERGYVDEVIEPARTRPKLIAGLRLLKNKRDSNPPRKHGNIPL